MFSIKLRSKLCDDLLRIEDRRLSFFVFAITALDLLSPQPLVLGIYLLFLIKKRANVGSHDGDRQILFFQVSWCWRW